MAAKSPYQYRHLLLKVPRYAEISCSFLKIRPCKRPINSALWAEVPFGRACCQRTSVSVVTAAPVYRCPSLRKLLLSENRASSGFLYASSRKSGRMPVTCSNISWQLCMMVGSGAGSRVAGLRAALLRNWTAGGFSNCTWYGVSRALDNQQSGEDFKILSI